MSSLRLLAPLLLLALTDVVTATPFPRLLPRYAFNASSLQVKYVGISRDVVSTDTLYGLRYTRDGGYVGVVGNKTFQMNFDTLLCTDDLTSCPDVIGSNSFNYLDTATGEISDPPDAYNLCATNTQTGEDELVWLTNVIELNKTHGVGWFQVHTDDPGEPAVNNGVALLDVSQETPVCTRIVNSLMRANDAPMYGFHGAIQGRGNDSYIYLYGSDMSPNAVRGGWGTVYLARVSPRMAGTVQAYQYWNGYRFVGSQAAAVPVMNDTVPGSVSYSDYHKSYVYLFPSDPFGRILARTAPTPQGPWTNTSTVFDGGLYYSPQALPVKNVHDALFTLQYSTQATSGAYYQRKLNITWY